MAEAAAEWLPDERQCIDQFLLALLDDVVAGALPVRLEPCLILMAQAGTSLTGAIRRVLDHPSGTGTLAVAGMASWSATTLNRRTLLNAYWEDYRAELQLVVSELADPHVAKTLEEAVLSTSDKNEAQILSDGLTAVESIGSVLK